VLICAAAAPDNRGYSSSAEPSSITVSDFSATAGVNVALASYIAFINN
jgi:hypothetical protein